MTGDTFPKVRFSCTLCGDCCRDVPGHRRNILLLRAEAEEISAATGLTPGEFCAKLKGHPPYGEFRMRKKGGRCVFLGENDECAIYARRPLICRFFPFTLKDGEWGHSERCEGIGKGGRLPAKFFKGLEREARRRLAVG